MPPPYFKLKHVPLRCREAEEQLPLPLFTEPQEAPLQNTRRVRPKPASENSSESRGLALSVLSLAGSLAILAHNGSLGQASAMLTVIGVHELGHLFAAQWLGIPVSWPVFLGPFGAFINLRRPFANPVEEAWVGVAGPVAGVLATVAIHYAANRCDSTVLMKAALFGYLVHLFNLIPAGILDGARIAALLGRWLWVPGCVALLWYVYKFADLGWKNCLLIPMLLLPAFYRAWQVLSGKDKTLPAPHVPYKAVHYCCVLFVSIAVLLTCAVGLWRAGESLSERESAEVTRTHAGTAEEPGHILLQ